MSWVRSLLVCVLAILALAVVERGAQAQTACVPNPNASGPPFVNECPLPASGLNVLGNFIGPAFGAVCDGVTNDTVALQSAITAGGTIVIPAGKSCKFTSTLILGTSNLTIMGNGGSSGSALLCRTGSSDCIASVASSRIGNVTLRDFTINATGQTGGNCLNMNNVADLRIAHLALTNCFNGTIFTNTNNVTMGDHTIMNATNSSNAGYCVKFYTNPNTGTRSDVLNILDATCNNSYSGASGLIWDGASYTLRIDNFNIISTAYGIRALNTAVCNGSVSASCTAGSGPGWPQFADISHLEVDGASANACSFETGWDFMIDSSLCTNQSGGAGQGSADGAGLQILPDGTGGITRRFRITNSYFGDSKTQAMYLGGCQDCFFSNNIFSGASKAGVGSFPAVEVDAQGANVTFVGGRMGPYDGDIVNASYGLKIDSGAGPVDAIGVNMNRNVTGSYLDGTGNAVILGGVAFNGKNMIQPVPVWDHLAFFSAASPTATSCGTSPSVSGTDASGVVSTGTGTVTACTLNFANNAGTWATAPVCIAGAMSTSYTASAAPASTSAVTFNFSVSIPSTQFAYHCFQG